jgi:hypothetical protein
MVAIYVPKSWLKTIGEVADLIVFREEGDTVSLLAAGAAANPPFVDAQLARRRPSENGSAFLPAQIPITSVFGIFDLTEQEQSKYGFQNPNQERGNAFGRIPRRGAPPL